ncbi:uncharacterized protein LOC129614397 isoform X2 [Condylostylus longicornis]|uniref:uncharacterized protein LOC129614397 isoform X2 n=1 Tax=Condylostylus longicornis TaxID=2530218 RepID=UPI00244DB1C2|nr:uncharacterized protein LOC129614397 isoform X2 [Condylostylus longicornis]
MHFSLYSSALFAIIILIDSIAAADTGKEKENLLNDLLLGNKFDANKKQEIKKVNLNSRFKRTLNEAQEIPENYYEFFQQKPLPNNTSLEKLPPWALKQLVWLIKILQNCASTPDTIPPRRGRQALYDDNERIEFTPRMGKKSVPFKPRLGKRNFNDENNNMLESYF